MIVTVIGRLFLDYYNSVHNCELSAETFFNTNLAEHIFCEQPFWYSQTLQALQNNDEIEDKQSAFKEILLNGVNMANAAGYFTVNPESSLSSQVHNTESTPEDAYLAWIGYCLGCGVNAGFAFYFHYPEILIDVFEGWKFYRKFLNSSVINAKPFQIQAWNSNWLCMYYEDNFRNDLVISKFQAYTADNKDGRLKVVSMSWLHFLYKLSNKYKNEVVQADVQRIAHLNTTVGSVFIHFSKLRKPIEMYSAIFSEKIKSGGFFDNKDEIEAVFGKSDALLRICEFGKISDNIIDPNNIIAFLNNINLNKSEFSLFLTYLLNLLGEDESFLQLIKEVSAILKKWESAALKMKTDRTYYISVLLKIVNKHQFRIKARIFGLLSEIQHLWPKIDVIKNENFKYFVILLKLIYNSK